MQTGVTFCLRNQVLAVSFPYIQTGDPLARLLTNGYAVVKYDKARGHPRCKRWGENFCLCCIVLEWDEVVLHGTPRIYSICQTSPQIWPAFVTHQKLSSQSYKIFHLVILQLCLFFMSLIYVYILSVD